MISAVQLQQALARGGDVRVLDVRTGAEFDREHIAGAYNVPLDRLPEHAEALGGARSELVVVCRSGARARSAHELLRGAGARRLRLLDGGMLAWKAAGLPIEGRPLTIRAVLGRLLGMVALAYAVISARENALLGAMLAFVGLRLLMGQSVLPCAAMGTCAVPRADTGSIVRTLLDGQPAT